MNLRMKLAGAVAVLAFAEAGCGAADGSAAQPTSSATPAPPSATASSAPAPTGVGLAESDNDPAIVALAKAALKCMPQQGGALGVICDDFAAWTFKNTEAFKSPDKTLVAMLEDPDPKVRWLAATKLVGFSTRATTIY